MSYFFVTREDKGFSIKGLFDTKMVEIVPHPMALRGKSPVSSIKSNNLEFVLCNPPN